MNTTSPTTDARDVAAEHPVSSQGPLTMAPPRRIIHRTRGSQEGPITRLVSPGDLGQLIKPFIFLDRFDLDPLRYRSGFGYHPHSGIATVTTLLNGSVHYEDTTGKSGTMDAGGVEWMRAGQGVWHAGHPTGTERVAGFQLWVALPPELEMEQAESVYLSRAEVPDDGPVRAILGAYGTAQSSISSGSPMNYLHVSLSAGERWRYQPPAGHDVAWIAVGDGHLAVAGTQLHEEIAVFEDGDRAIDVQAHGAASFVLGSARRHPHALVMGPYSVHTSRETLASGAREIARIGRALRSHPGT
jgi:redox-sensitive bicupin YhaK (pirin superfamily)